MCHHALVEFFYDANEVFWATKLVHNLPKTVPVHSVKGLSDVNKGHQKGNIVFLSFLLDLPGSEDHVCGATSFAKTTLGFWKEVVLKMSDEAIEQESCQDFSSDA